MNKILITGAAGFIGVKLARELINKKNKIYLLDNLSRGKSDIFFKDSLSPLFQGHEKKTIFCSVRSSCLIGGFCPC